MSIFSERLNELMFEHDDIKSEQLGKEIGISGATIRRWLSGGQQIFLSNLIILADYFECSIDFLVGKTENTLDFEPQKCPPFSKRLREVMKEKGVTTYKLRKNTRYGSKYFQQWDSGSDPLSYTLIELADILNCSVDYLIGRER